MKKIKLIQSRTPDKSSIFKHAHSNTLCLGNGISVRISDRRKFNSAVYHINEELTEILFLLNDAYTLCFTEYREAWYYLGNEYSYIIRKADDSNFELTRLFTLLSDRNGWANGNFFSFKYLDQIVEILVNWLEPLIELRHKKRHFIEMRILKIKQRQIGEIRDRIKQIGLEYQNGPEKSKVMPFSQVKEPLKLRKVKGL